MFASTVVGSICGRPGVLCVLLYRATTLWVTSVHTTVYLYICMYLIPMQVDDTCLKTIEDQGRTCTCI